MKFLIVFMLTIGSSFLMAETQYTVHDPNNRIMTIDHQAQCLFATNTEYTLYLNEYPHQLITIDVLIESDEYGKMMFENAALRIDRNMDQIVLSHWEEEDGVLCKFFVGEDFRYNPDLLK